MLRRWKRRQSSKGGPGRGGGVHASLSRGWPRGGGRGQADSRSLVAVGKVGGGGWRREGHPRHRPRVRNTRGT